MSIVKPVASDSPGWITRLARWIPRVRVRVEIPALADDEETSETPEDTPAPEDQPERHPLLVPNPNPKSWLTLFDNHEPAGKDFMAERPLNVKIKW
ncbi:MAG: hypothetical protein MPK06_05375 [Alphaproteobacteria bacterium]|nr:hypothetical protein [Alphaproteobacteria bacterium]MDA8003939.1 hypothetical protein [Alphaproteobacteria bacterium]MDA8005952.1 hypothetical protein [Alphaproteobacteria bacterium]MDA8013232.1 hypothetical protein [Alphaproteobacteria bacterium]